jgi:cyanate permease
MFLIPIASVVLLVFLWWADLLPRPYVVAACVVVGVAGLLFAPVFSLAWAAALLLDGGAAIYMAIVLKLNS